jgi:uncharacterized protein YecE (DUF72 family)
MKTKRPGCHVGTSGWSYKHWQGLFYPENIKQDKYLEYYLTRFSCVELNSSFYHLPRETTIRGWMDRTPETFRFCPKLSRFITHRKRLADSHEPLERFIDLFSEMKARMGPVLIQLPPGLKYDHSLVADFVHILSEQYHDYRFAMEVRHKSWIQDEFFHLLSQHGISFVIADSDQRFPYHEVVTANFVYLRFHGPAELYASDYPAAVLYGYAEKISKWLEEGLSVWVFFNNDFGGYAVKNAMNIIEMVNAI